MTIETQVNKINYATDGNATVFTYNFKVLEKDHMIPLLDDVEITDPWSIEGLGNPYGGKVTFATAPMAGKTLTLLRVVPMTQEVHYTPDPFPEDTHEFALDKLTMLIQQLQEQAVRGVSAGPSYDGTTDLRLPQYEAGKLIGWCEASQALCNFDRPDCPPAYVDPYREMYGLVDSAGSEVKGFGGFSSAKSATGTYQVTFDVPITEDYAVVASLAEDAPANVINVTNETTTGFTVKCRNAGGAGPLLDAQFSFHLVYEVAA